MKKLLLVSNSTVHGKKYLGHCADEIKTLFQNSTNVLFIPYAIADRDNYAKIVTQRFNELGISISSIHTEKNPQKAVTMADGIFIGGGNTFRLLSTLYKEKLISTIKEKVAKGMPYMGSSAGSNMACPTIKTTNDMPIVYPPSFDALGLIPFQINPHYLDSDPNSKHMGETREQRIKEFHEENSTPVVGLREGAWLTIMGKKASLQGTTGAKLFQKGKESKELKPGTNLSFLL